MILLLCVDCDIFVIIDWVRLIHWSIWRYELSRFAKNCKFQKTLQWRKSNSYVYSVHIMAKRRYIYIYESPGGYRFYEALKCIVKLSSSLQKGNLIRMNSRSIAYMCNVWDRQWWIERDRWKDIGECTVQNSMG